MHTNSQIASGQSLKTMFGLGDYFNYLRKIYLHDGEVKGEWLLV